MTTRYGFGIVLLLMCVLLACPGAASPQEEAAPDAKDTPAEEVRPAAEPPAPSYSLDFPGVVARLSAAVAPEDLLKEFNAALSGCKTYDDYEKLASEVRALADKAPSGNAGVLNYAAAKARIAELAFLSRSNDLDSGRIYMTVNEGYCAEALDRLDKALLVTTSKDMAVDINFLKFMVLKDRFQPEKAAAAFDGIANSIMAYSDDRARNISELFRVCAEFEAAGSGEYAAKLRTAYASKTDKATAREIFETMRKEADRLFEQGDQKKAAAIYEQYTELARSYFTREELAPKIMEMAEKYFKAGKYKEAKRHYGFYLQNFGDSKVADYASYQLALCFYNEHDYAKSIEQLELFITNYQTSIWYDKAFEALARMYYENFPRDRAMAGIERLIDKYYRKNVGDYALILIGLLYYQGKEYDAAAARFKKVEPSSIYFYTAETLLEDIRKIKKFAGPSFGTADDNLYRVWEPGEPVTAQIVALREETAKGLMGRMGAKERQRIESIDTAEGLPMIEVKPGSRIDLSLEKADDPDTFTAYVQDKEDVSRLPRKTGTHSEKDLLSVQWTGENGKFADEKQSRTRQWQAPEQPGIYKVSVRVDDLGLVRQPDRGLRKDSAKDAGLVIVVK